MNRRNTRLAAKSIDLDGSPQRNMNKEALTKSAAQLSKDGSRKGSPLKDRIKSAKKLIEEVKLQKSLKSGQLSKALADI